MQEEDESERDKTKKPQGHVCVYLYVASSRTESTAPHRARDTYVVCQRGQEGGREDGKKGG